jgi:long-chain acyl-CoA synthetase
MQDLRRRASIHAGCRRFAGPTKYAVPRAVLLSHEPWTIENTMLTPTLKLKRLNLMARFDAELAAMYGPR